MNKEALIKERDALRETLTPIIDRLAIVNMELDLHDLKGQCVGILARQVKPITTIELLDMIYPPEIAIEMELPEYRRTVIMALSLVLHRLCKSHIISSQKIKGRKGKLYQIISKSTTYNGTKNIHKRHITKGRGY